MTMLKINSQIWRPNQITEQTMSWSVELEKALQYLFAYANKSATKYIRQLHLYEIKDLLAYNKEVTWFAYNSYPSIRVTRSDYATLVEIGDTWYVLCNKQDARITELPDTQIKLLKKAFIIPPEIDDFAKNSS